MSILYKDHMTTMFHVLYGYVSTRPTVHDSSFSQLSFILDQGYIMTDYRGQHNNSIGRTMFECVNGDQEPFFGSHPIAGPCSKCKIAKLQNEVAACLLDHAI